MRKKLIRLLDILDENKIYFQMGIVGLIFSFLIVGTIVSNFGNEKLHRALDAIASPLLSDLAIQTNKIFSPTYIDKHFAILEVKSLNLDYRSQTELHGYTTHKMAELRDLIIVHPVLQDSQTYNVTTISPISHTPNGTKTLYSYAMAVWIIDLKSGSLVGYDWIDATPLKGFYSNSNPPTEEEHWRKFNAWLDSIPKR